MAMAKSSAPDRDLTAKERSFVDAYMACLEPSEAVRRSAYKVSKSEGAASSYAYKLMRRPRIKQAIEEWQRTRSLKAEVAMDDLVQELMPLAFLHPAQVLEDDFTPKALSDMGDAAKALKKVRVTTRSLGESGSQTVTEVEFHSKLDAIDKLAKHIGFYSEDRAKEQEANHLAEIRERMTQAMERAAAFPIGGHGFEDDSDDDDHARPAIEDAEVMDDDAPRDPVTGEVIP